MTTIFPEYDEIHVVSDLHMGGVTPDFQILKQSTRLAGFFRWVSKQKPSGRMALVLNGDVIDTLAEESVGYIAVEQAASVVSDIINREPFSEIWDALADFVKKPGRMLIIVIGNHDIEMAFPTVQHVILDRLAGDSLAARARIEFSTMGAGYTCQVGAAKVYCIHGNEVDPWNFVRYEDLSRAARRINANLALTQDEWQPNAGTKMVKDVMNHIKKRYKWIDLLKPEAQAAVGVLLVLDPGQLQKINRLLPIIGKKIKGDRQYNQRLSADGYTTSEQEPAQDYAVEQLLGSEVKKSIKGGTAGSDASVDDLLLEMEDSYASTGTTETPPTDLLGTGQVIWDRLTGWISGVGKDEALRKALQDWLHGDDTFDLDKQDDTFKAVTAAVGEDIDFIITGHTHLHRAIKMPGDRHYFNCGTWIRLLKFSDEMLKDNASFKAYFDILEDGSMASIDATETMQHPLLLDRTSAVCIRVEGNRTIGELARINDEAENPRQIIYSS